MNPAEADRGSTMRYTACRIKRQRRAGGGGEGNESGDRRRMARERLEIPREVDKRTKARLEVEALHRESEREREMRTNIIQNYPAWRSRLSHISLSKGVFVHQGGGEGRGSPVHRARHAACSFSTRFSNTPATFYACLLNADRMIAFCTDILAWVTVWVDMEP